MPITTRKMTAMTILVTGATGFLGRHLLPLLAGRRVRVLVLPGDPERDHLQTMPVEIVEGDVTVLPTLIKPLHGIRQVIHLAGLVNGGQGNPEDFIRVNTQGTANLARACRMAGVEHFVYSSSTTIYGSGADVHEDAQLQPTPGYPISKIKAEHALRELLGNSSAVLRFPLVLGASDRGFMRPTVHAFQKIGRVIIIGSGREKWSVISAGDAARALIMAIDKPLETRGQTYNVTGALTTNGELLQAIGAGAGCRQIVHIPISLAMGIARLSELLHWQVFTRDQVLALSGPLFANSSRFEALGFTPESNWRTVLAEGVEWSLRTSYETFNPVCA